MVDELEDLLAGFGVCWACLGVMGLDDAGSRGEDDSELKSAGRDIVGLGYDIIDVRIY